MGRMIVQIHVLLTGNCPLKSQGICANVSVIDNSIVFETATELNHLPELCSLHQPDLLLLVLDSWETQVNAIAHRLPAVNVLGLSAQNGQVCHTLIHNNVINGCLPETSPPEILIQAIRTVASGHTWFSQPLLKTILRPTPQPNEKQSVLTNRELAVLRLVTQERTNKEIARELGMGKRTVCDHLSAIYEKLGVASRVGAALKAERFGLVE